MISFNTIITIKIISMIHLTIFVNNVNASWFAHSPFVCKGKGYNTKFSKTLIIQFINFYNIHNQICFKSISDTKMVKDENNWSKVIRIIIKSPQTAKDLRGKLQFITH